MIGNGTEPGEKTGTVLKTGIRLSRGNQGFLKNLLASVGIRETAGKVQTQTKRVRPEKKVKIRHKK
jgi:hypothetical protein